MDYIFNCAKKHGLPSESTELGLELPTKFADIQLSYF
jgi:hypothetical protein